MDPFKKFAFKKSALSDKADKIWSESKNDFSAKQPTATHVQLEKKSLGDVLEKMASTKEKEKEKDQENPKTFVFGSKISERIVKDDKVQESSTSKEGDNKLTATELFQTAVKKDEQKNGASNFREEAVQEAERAKEAERQQASTSVVEITTGEEKDVNIFQANCKIWIYDKERQKYAEKGVCVLRINKIVDDNNTHYRVVARTSGTLRVVINSKIFPDMVLERPDKRIRISAMGPDSNLIQVFLLKFGFSKTDTGAEADQFYATVGRILNKKKDDQTRKRKADNDLNPDDVKIKDLKEEEEEEIENNDNEKTSDSSINKSVESSEGKGEETA